MYYFLSVLAGVFIAVMVLINGKLTTYYGVYSATSVIHLIGLLFVLILLGIKRQRILPERKLPFHLYLGGAVGLLTIVFNNISFGRISLSAILALGLLGQCLTSLVLDKYGFWNMPKHPYSKKKLFGIALVAFGILPMVMDADAGAVVPIIVSLLTGVTVVVSRTINASLAQRTSVLSSTFFNYGVGFVLSLGLLMIAGRGEPMLSGVTLSPAIWIYLGGIIGVCLVTLLNASVHRISSFYMTLLLFAGQVFAGIALDIVLSGAFSPQNLIGGLLVTAGLVQNLLVDRNDARKKAPAGR